MPLPFPKLHEKCETPVCQNRDERWEDVLQMRQEEKYRKCRDDRAALAVLYYQETENVRLNPLGGYLGTIKLETRRFGVERRKCAIDTRGIFVSMNVAMERIITSFRPILNRQKPPTTNDQFKQEALLYYRRHSEKPWGQ